MSFHTIASECCDHEPSRADRKSWSRRGRARCHGPVPARLLPTRSRDIGVGRPFDNHVEEDVQIQQETLHRYFRLRCRRRAPPTCRGLRRGADEAPASDHRTLAASTNRPSTLDEPRNRGAAGRRVALGTANHLFVHAERQLRHRRINSHSYVSRSVAGLRLPYRACLWTSRPPGRAGYELRVRRAFSCRRWPASSSRPLASLPSKDSPQRTPGIASVNSGILCLFCPFH